MKGALDDLASRIREHPIRQSTFMGTGRVQKGYQVRPDPARLLPGEETVVAPRGGSGTPPGGAVADLVAPPSTRGYMPVYVEVTNYRLNLHEPVREDGATLYVTLCGGHNLVKANGSGLPDPYAALSLTGSGRHGSLQRPKTTKSLRSTLNPIWNETFVFHGTSQNADLSIEIYDKKSATVDAYMGEVMVQDVIRREHNGRQNQWSLRLPVTFQGVSEQRGFLSVCIRCVWQEQGYGDIPAHIASVPLMCIEEAKVNTAEKRVEVFTKTATQFTLFFDEPEDATNVHRALNEYPAALDKLPCFSQLPSLKEYRRFSWARELRRWAAPDHYRSRWCIDVEINKGFGLCPTYSKEVVIPVGLSVRQVEASAKLRTKSRFPIVSWVHPRNGAVLARCSQPRIGANPIARGSNPCKADWEYLMNFVSEQRRELTIFDARPYRNAVANRLGGGGTEYDVAEQYQGCRVQFLDIDNIHVMRDSLHVMRAGVCQHSSLDTCGVATAQWYHHIEGVLRGAGQVAQVVESGETAVVHCSDGWDRTSQLVSLASLLLDGHYRTIAGLIDLVEKDWLQPGHKFMDRNGLLSRKEQATHYKEQSPVFLQFLECIVQISRVYTRYFEYTPRLLSFILYHSLSGHYATFLGNCMKDRETLNNSVRAPHGCLWTEVMRLQSLWVNPLYDSACASEPIVPCHVPLRQIGFCEEFYASVAAVWPGNPNLPREPGLWHFRMATTRWSHTRITKVDSGPRYTGSLSVAPEDGNYIFCDIIENNTVATMDRIQRCDRLLRKFTGLRPGFPPQPHVRVASYSVVAGHIRFLVEITAAGTGDVHHTVRRFSEFAALREDLKLRCSVDVDIRFPPKRSVCEMLIGHGIDARVVMLDTWFRAIVCQAWLLGEERHRGIPQPTQSFSETQSCVDRAWESCFGLAVPEADIREHASVELASVQQRRRTVEQVSQEYRRSSSRRSGASTGMKIETSGRQRASSVIMEESVGDHDGDERDEEVVVRAMEPMGEGVGGGIQLPDGDRICHRATM